MDTRDLDPDGIPTADRAAADMAVKVFLAGILFVALLLAVI